MSARIMFCTTQHAMYLRGTYPIGDGLDWEWRIVIQSVSAQVLKAVIYDVSPEGPEDLAVQIDLQEKVG